MALEGDRFGSYTLMACLGEGGMGEVWKAMDTRLERIVALKLMKGEEESVRKALIREAKTASQLTHPNIAVIYEAGELDGVPFIAMEYVEGQTLAKRLGERLGEAELLSIARQAAEALQHAHGRGVIHRDIKPENLVITAGGHLEILDFGIAKRAVLEAESGASAPTQVHLTQPGVSMGTPAYMSPEQVYGQAVTALTDQFSLGVVLRELAIGEHIFKRESMLLSLHAVAKDQPWPLAQLRPDLAPAFCTALERMIEKKPDARFPDFQAFLDALPAEASVAAPRVSAAPGIPTSAPPRARAKRRRIAALAGVLIMAAGGFIAFKVRSGSAPAVPSSKVVALLPVTLQPGDPARSWVATSLADAMNTSLLRRGDLRVLDRQWVADAARRKGYSGNLDAQVLRELGTELKADLLVMGDCRMDGDQLNIHMRMVEVGQASPSKEFTVEGTMGGLLTLEDNLAARLPGLFGLDLPQPGGTGGPTVHSGGHVKAQSLRTRELYARALELVDRGNIDAYDTARTLFREAIELEPAYAPAHAGLAWALRETGAAEAHLGRKDAALIHFKEAEASARKAIQLDPKSPLAHRALGAALIHQSRFDEAQRAAAKAVSLDPVDHQALVGLAEAYAYGDRADERAKARRHFTQALEVAPANWYAHTRFAVLLQNDGDLEESVREADRAFTLQPSSEYSYLSSAVSLLWLGRTEEALNRLESGLLQVPGSKLLKLTMTLAAHARGDAGAYRRFERDLNDAWPSGHIISVLLAGLDLDLRGRPGETRKLFLGEAREARRTDWSTKTASDRRSTSVNLYHMARTLALRKDEAAAREVLEASEALNPGKLNVSSKDPAFQALKKAPG